MLGSLPVQVKAERSLTVRPDINLMSGRWIRLSVKFNAGSFGDSRFESLFWPDLLRVSQTQQEASPGLTWAHLGSPRVAPLRVTGRRKKDDLRVTRVHDGKAAEGCQASAAKSQYRIG